jgi:hypothetical protein
MECDVSSGLLDEVDGLNPSRALILQAYYAVRRTRAPSQIGTRDIERWIKRHEPGESLPSDSLILLTLRHAKVMHRPPGRPRTRPPGTESSSPFFPSRQSPHHAWVAP